MIVDFLLYWLYFCFSSAGVFTALFCYVELGDLLEMNAVIQLEITGDRTSY